MTIESSQSVDSIVKIYKSTFVVISMAYDTGIEYSAGYSE